MNRTPLFLNPLPPLLRSRAERGAMAIAALLLVASGFLPQFGGPGYESALAGGLILPSAAAAGAALSLVRRTTPVIDAYGRGIALGAVLGLLGAVVATLHGLRSGFCDAALGYELWFTGPVPGAILGGAWGSIAALVTTPIRRAPLWALLLALAAPFGGIAMSLGRFYTSPMVFAFDPFFGYFAGPLYDTVIDPGDRLLTYRIGSLGTLLCGAVLALHLEQHGPGRLRWRWLGRPGLLLSGLFALGVSGAITLLGPELGHYSTQQSIEQALGRELWQGRCRIVYSAGIPRRDAERVGRECASHLPEIEHYLAARGPEQVTVFLFASDREKGALMGASRTYIAKPWRAETYVQIAGFPHPTLGHELAHVVTGSFGPGPFRVAGPLGGLIPDPGRIEGIAVAASPGEDDDFTLLEWSKALLELGLLPPLESVFQLDFLAKASSTAYTVAGAFVSWLHDRYGARAVRDWYSGRSLESVTGGKSLSALEREFRADLKELELMPELLAMAKSRFDRPSIFGRVCPRRIDRDLDEAEQLLASGNVRGARDALRDLLKLDRDNARAKLLLGSCDIRAGELEAALKRYAELSRDPKLSALEKAAALEARGDVALMAGDGELAAHAYAEVARITADEDRRRTLDVKRRAGEVSYGEAIRTLLIGDPVLGPSWDEAAPALGAASVGSSDGLPAYLIGRHLWLSGRTEAALEYLDRALAAPELLPRVRREALRLRVVATCSEPHFARAPAADALRRLREDPGAPAAKKEATVRLAARCGIGGEAELGQR